MANNAIADAEAFFVNLGGKRIKGWADATAYNVSYDQDQIQKVTGLNGLGAFSKNITIDATLTFELLQTSGDNDVLSIFHTVNMKTNGGFLTTLVAHDGNGTSVQSSLAVAVVKFPDFGISNGVETRVWTLIAANLESFVGGTNAPQVGTFLRAQELAAALPPVELPS